MHLTSSVVRLVSDGLGNSIRGVHIVWGLSYLNYFMDVLISVINGQM